MVKTGPNTLHPDVDREHESVGRTRDRSTAVASPPELRVDVAAVIAAFGRRLRSAGMPVTPAQCEQYARSLALTRPVSRRELYWTTLAIFVKDRRQLEAFDEVFRDVFGAVDSSAFRTAWGATFAAAPA